MRGVRRVRNTVARLFHRVYEFRIVYRAYRVSYEAFCKTPQGKDRKDRGKACGRRGETDGVAQFEENKKARA